MNLKNALILKMNFQGGYGPSGPQGKIKIVLHLQNFKLNINYA